MEVQENSGVSAVSPDGSTGPVPAEPNDMGVKPAETLDLEKQRDERLVTEQAEDDRLGNIYDRIMGKDEPTRGPDGKFTSATNPEEKSEGNEGQKSDQKAQEQQQIAAAIDMPKAWPAAKKPVWEALSPEAREFIHSREQNAHAAITRQGQTLSAFKPLGEMLNKYRPTFERHNASPVQGIQRLLEVQNSLDTNPGETILKIAKAYNVDLHRLVTGTASNGAGNDGNQNEIEVSPAEAALIEQNQMLAKEINELKTRLDTRDTNEVTIARRQEQALQHQTTESVMEWSKDKPYYEDVRQLMAGFIASGEADDLDQAYDMACYAKPSVRSKLEEDKTKAAKARETQENAKRVSEAKRAASLQVGSRSTKTVQSTGKSWDDDSRLEAIYERANSG